MVSVDKLANYPIFSDFTSEQIDQVCTCAEVKTYSKGSVVIEESSTYTEFFIILSGRVDVEMQSYGRQALGGGKRLALLRNGDVVGDMAFLQQRRRTAQATAIDDVKVLCIAKDSLDEVFEADPKLGFLFMRNVARIISQRLVDLNFMWRDDV